MTTAIERHPRGFAGDERGSIAPMFGLMFLVLMFVFGMALDYGRVIHTESKLLAAADGAALAGGRALLDGRLSDDDVRALTLKFFNENANQSGKFGDVKNVTVDVDRATGGVTVHVDADVPMTVTRIGGFDKTNLPVTSAVLSDQHDIELGMALDLTGSMGGQKIADLRDAARDLVDILLPDGGTPNKVRIGLAPYSASVNAGSYAGRVTNGASTNGCVHERSGFAAFTDDLPGPGAWLGFSRGLYCPTATVRPLTSDKAGLKATIASFTAGGSTAGHLGAAWASYLVSPKWSSLWPAASEPAAYGDGKTIKAIILMTDGEFNTEYLRANGDSASQARRVCTETKGRNVVVFAVGFMAPRDAERLLLDCATSPNHYFSAANGGELRQAFIEIANQLNNLRLTQ